MFNLLQKWPHFSPLYVAIPLAMRLCRYQEVAFVFPPLESGLGLGLALATQCGRVDGMLALNQGPGEALCASACSLWTPAVTLRTGPSLEDGRPSE